MHGSKGLKKFLYTCNRKDMYSPLLLFFSYSKADYIPLSTLMSASAMSIKDRHLRSYRISLHTPSCTSSVIETFSFCRSLFYSCIWHKIYNILKQIEKHTYTEIYLSKNDIRREILFDFVENILIFLATLSHDFLRFLFIEIKIIILMNFFISITLQKAR